MGLNMGMLQQLQARMMKQMQQMQEELAKETVEATAGGGAVTVKMTGQLKLESVTIAPEAVDPDDVEVLQDMIVAAVNEAIAKSRSLQEQRLAAITGGLRIPGIM